GVRLERVMTDNGSCYQSKMFRAACKRLGLRQVFTRPYTPRTNGKAERFIQTALREWAYARAYHNSDQRSDELMHWLHRYNWHRPHGSLKANTPISRLGLSEDNVLRLHTQAVRSTVQDECETSPSARVHRLLPAGVSSAMSALDALQLVYA